MPKNVTFNLGPTAGLNTRTLTVRRMQRAGDDVAPAADHGPTDAGAVTTVTVELPDNTIFQATLADVMTQGATARPLQKIQFHTGDLLHLGPEASQPSSSRFAVLDMEDLSSSSSVSSSSVSSSSSPSSESSSSSSVSSSASSGGSSASSVSSSASSQS